MGYPLSLSRLGNQFESDIDRKWGRMYQGGVSALQAPRGAFNSLRLHNARLVLMVA